MELSNKVMSQFINTKLQTTQGQVLHELLFEVFLDLCTNKAQ